MATLHALVVFGTRPEAIKLAPVIAECRRRADEITTTVCFTGQHRELVLPLAKYFHISPDIEFAAMRPGQSLTQLAARLLRDLDSVLASAKPDCVVAQGDTTTVLCAALAAFYHRVTLVHVEAGLRGGDLEAPWPEEFNRRVATLATALHCAPTQGAARNLLAEGVPSHAVYLTGNTVIDALLQTVERERANGSCWARKYRALGDRRVVLVTGHRRENQGQGLCAVCAAVGLLAGRFPDVEFVYPVHPNPQVYEPVRRMLAGRANIHLVPPVTYPEFVWMMDRSTFIITDSGGIQEEAPSLGKPVLVTRDQTERPEAVARGFARLVGTDTNRIVHEATALLEGRRRLRCNVNNPFGDGRAAERVVELMVERVPTLCGSNKQSRAVRGNA